MISTSPPAAVAATPSADWRALYPFASHELRIRGQRYHYLDEGSGEPLLLVHGNPTWSFHWRNLISAWRGNFRTIAPDHLGCGLSDKPQHGSIRLADHVSNLVQLIDELDLRQFTLLAQDWGGAIGLGAALARPDRCARIVLFNTGAYPPWFIPWRIRCCRWPIVGRLGVQGGNLFVRAALRMTMNRRRLSPAEQAGYVAPYDSWNHRRGVYQFVEDIPMSPAHPTHRTLAEIEAGLPRLADRPIQLIWGMRDWCFRPACLEKFQSIFPTAEVERFDDAGHWVVEDAADEIVALVEDFLGRHPLCDTGGGVR